VKLIFSGVTAVKEIDQKRRIEEHLLLPEAPVHPIVEIVSELLRAFFDSLYALVGDAPDQLKQWLCRAARDRVGVSGGPPHRVPPTGLFPAEDTVIGESSEARKGRSAFDRQFVGDLCGRKHRIIGSLKHGEQLLVGDAWFSARRRVFAHKTKEDTHG
jgi:hypothetical protein